MLTRPAMSMYGSRSARISDPAVADLKLEDEEAGRFVRSEAFGNSGHLSAVNNNISKGSSFSPFLLEKTSRFRNLFASRRKSRENVPMGVVGDKSAPK